MLLLYSIKNNYNKNITMSRTQKHSTNYSLKQSKQSKKTKKNKISIINKKLTARIIIKDNVGGIVADKDTIKELLESIGYHVEVVVYNDIKDKLVLKQSILFKKVNIQIFIEHVLLEKMPADKSYIFINQEYISDWDIALMKEGLIIPLCKTHEGLKTLFKLGVSNAKYVGFGNNRKISHIDSIEKISNLFIHIVGASPLKGTRLLIETWINKKIKEPLIITANNKAGGNTDLFKFWKSLKPKVKELPESILNKWEEWKNFMKLQITNTNTKSVSNLPPFESIGTSSVYFCNTVLDYNVIQFLQSVADVHMCPSLIEGWGQYIDEGRRSKAVVLTLNAPPMNELIDNNISGILVNASRGPSMKQLLPYGWIQYFTKDKEYNKFLYKTYKTSQHDLYNSIIKILKMSPDQKRKLGNNAFKQSQLDYNKFSKKFIEIIKI